MDFVNTKPTDVLHSNDRFRLTWERPLGAFLPSFTWDAPARAIAVRDWLPAQGAVPISSPSSVKGDESIVFDIRPAESMSGRIVAQLVSQLGDPPGIFPAEPRLVKWERITYGAAGGMSASQVNQINQAVAVATGNVAANANPVLDAAGDAAKKLRDIMRATYIAAAVLVVLGIGTYAYISKKR